MEKMMNRINDDFIVNVGPKFASEIPNTHKKYYDYLGDPKKQQHVHEANCRKRFQQNKSAGNDNIM